MSLNMDPYFKEAFEILKKPSSYTQYTELEVSDYSEIIEMWNAYKREKALPLHLQDNYMIKELFNFHYDTEHDHGILYYSYGNDDVLLMFKIRKLHFQIKASSDYLETNQRNVIAVYS